MWVELRASGRNPHVHRENFQTSQIPPQDQELSRIKTFWWDKETGAETGHMTHQTCSTIQPNHASNLLLHRSRYPVLLMNQYLLISVVNIMHDWLSKSLRKRIPRIYHPLFKAIFPYLKNIKLWKLESDIGAYHVHASLQEPIYIHTFVPALSHCFPCPSASRVHLPTI